jgi:hypothetical protein
MNKEHYSSILLQGSPMKTPFTLPLTFARLLLVFGGTAVIGGCAAVKNGDPYLQTVQAAQGLSPFALYAEKILIFFSRLCMQNAHLRPITV